VDRLQPFRLRDVPVLRALGDFGDLYRKAVEHRVSQTREQLGRAVQLMATKGNEARQNNDDMLERAKALSDEARKRSEAYLKRTRK